MSDIELVIKIPKEQYSLIMQSYRNDVERFIDKEAMMYAIKNGTPFPKGHGRLKDSVNRADLLKQFEDRFIELQKLKHIKENKSLEDEQLGVNWCINTLKDMPPATPIRKVGEWIKKNNDYFDWYECSECGYGSDGEMKYNRLCDVRTKFCPDCGSQNLKGEDE